MAKTVDKRLRCRSCNGVLGRRRRATLEVETRRVVGPAGVTLWCPECRTEHSWPAPAFAAPVTSRRATIYLGGTTYGDDD